MEAGHSVTMLHAHYKVLTNAEDRRRVVFHHAHGDASGGKHRHHARAAKIALVAGGKAKRG